MALLYGNMNDYLAGGAQLEQLYGNPYMGFSIKKLARKTVKVTKAVAKPVAKATVSVVKKTPAATISRAAVNIAKKPTLTNITRQTVKVAKATPIAQVARVAAPVVKPAARVVARNVKPAARVVAKVAPVVARNVMKSPLVKTAVASAIPGGAAALSVYDRLTASKKVIAPKPAARPAARPAAKPAPVRKTFTQKRMPTPPPKQRAPRATTPAPMPEALAPGVFERHKIPIMVGGGAALLLGIGAIIMAKKSK